jgi:hypothetical protein
MNCTVKKLPCGPEDKVFGPKSQLNDQTPQSIERHIPQTLSRPLQAAGSLLYTFSDSMYLDYFLNRVYRFNFGLSTSSCHAGSDVFLYRFGRTLTSEPVRYAALAYASLLRNRKVEATTLEYLGNSYSYLHKAISASQYEDATYACYILFKIRARLAPREGGEEAFQHAMGLFKNCKELRNSSSSLSDEEFYLMESLCVDVFRWLYGCLDRDSGNRAGFGRMAELVQGISFVLEPDARHDKVYEQKLLNKAQLFVLFMEIYFEYYVATLNDSGDMEESQTIETCLRNLVDLVIEVAAKILSANEVLEQGFVTGHAGDAYSQRRRPLHYMVRSIWELRFRYHSAMLLKNILFKAPYPLCNRKLAPIAIDTCNTAIRALNIDGSSLERQATQSAIIYASRSVFLAGMVLLALGDLTGDILLRLCLHL